MSNTTYVDIVHNSLSQAVPCTGYIVIAFAIVPVAIAVLLLALRFCCYCDRFTDCLLQRQRRRRDRSHLRDLEAGADAAERQPLAHPVGGGGRPLGASVSPPNASGGIYAKVLSPSSNGQASRIALGSPSRAAGGTGQVYTAGRQVQLFI